MFAPHLGQLHNAAQAGRSKVVNALLAKGADVNGRTDFKTTALHVAAANGYDGTVKVLIDKGADLNAKHGCFECTPIECACACCAPHVACQAMATPTRPPRGRKRPLRGRVTAGRARHAAELAGGGPPKAAQFCRPGLRAPALTA